MRVTLTRASDERFPSSLKLLGGRPAKFNWSLDFHQDNGSIMS